VCTLSASTVTYTGSGSCVIDANQAGNATYMAAPQVQRTITVNGIPQSISFTAPASGTAGGSARLSATGGGSGNPVVFSVDRASGPGVCTLSASTVTYTGSGSCVIDANQAGSATYTAAPRVQRTITVYPPPVVSGVSPATGQCNGGGTVTITGTGLNGATSVSFGSTAATKFTVDSSTQITVISPPGPGYSIYADITVTTPGGTSAITRFDKFEYVCLT